MAQNINQFFNQLLAAELAHIMEELSANQGMTSIQIFHIEIRRPSTDENLVKKIFEKCTMSEKVESKEECRVCMNIAEHPIGCKSCKNIVGCLDCCKRWASASMDRAGKPSCPLCRSEWTNSDCVVEVKVEDNETGKDQ